MASNLLTSTPNAKGKNNKRQRKGSNSCPKCDTDLTENRDYMECCVCELNFCVECTNITPLLLSALKEDTTQNFKWTCNGCKQNFPCMTGLTHQLKTIEENTKDRIDNMEHRMANMDRELGNRVKQEVSSLKEDLVKDVKSEIKTSLQDEVRKEILEIEDQRRRALNLIWFNLPESSSTNSLERKNYDLHHFKELCNRIGVPETDIAMTLRLGNKHDERNRPLKIVMNNKKHRKDIIDNTPNLKTGRIYLQTMHHSEGPNCKAEGSE